MTSIATIITLIYAVYHKHATYVYLMSKTFVFDYEKKLGYDENLKL
jgi:hypothetical protein